MEENLFNCQVRVAGYTSHRRKAVTPRDYERIILEAFPLIDCVKCIPCFDHDKPSAGTVTIAVVPAKEPGKEKTWKLLSPSYVRKQIKTYLMGCSSPKIKAIRVVNPDYLLVKIKCEIDIHPQFPLSNCKARLNTLFNDFIASWLSREETPCFGYSLSLSELYKQVRQQEYIHQIRHLSLILQKREQKYFRLQEYTDIKQVIQPPLPHTIFLPADEHTIGLKVLPSFGINEMDIDKNLIIK
ncbi:MAG: hypothetical protein LUD02_04270 [Tannerellaceae bacterium]|nr:hypothetical protein [Tannerellaceae bacterium]MCD8263462.1 hypothetical protein [Tannerellaceae bacterium]